MPHDWPAASPGVKPLAAASGVCSASAAAASPPPGAVCLPPAHAAMPAFGCAGIVAAEPCLDQAEGRKE